MHSFSIVRIIGNDLPPRHSSRQSIQNLQEILAREPIFPGCIKIWILNRIASLKLAASLYELIISAGYHCVVIPYRHPDYLLCPRCVPPPAWHFAFSSRKRRRLHLYSRRFRLMYITNVNPARNIAISIGHSFSKWAFPLDGNCILGVDSLAQILDAASNPDPRYLVVPMIRDRENLSASLSTLLELQEPQVAFRNDSHNKFNPLYYYGRRDKAELLKRLGVTGPWASWSTDSWESQPPIQNVLSREVAIAGHVLRLPSGYRDGELSSEKRLLSRDKACIALLNRLDRVKFASELHD